jgi:hypothetical protein
MLRARYAVCFHIILPLLLVAGGFCGEVRGTVFDTDGQTPKGGVTVMLSSPEDALRARHNLPRVVTTNANGQFSFDGLSVGNYTVRAILEAQQVLIATSQTRLLADDARVGVWVTLRPIASQGEAVVWGFVKTDEGVVLPDAQVVYRKVGSEDWKQAPVDEFGMYLVRVPEEGEYEVAAVGGVFAKAPQIIRRLLSTSIKSQTVKLTNGSVIKVDLVALQLPRMLTERREGNRLPDLRVEGQLVDEDGNAIAKRPFRVTSLRISGATRLGGQFTFADYFDLRAETDENGRFSVLIGEKALRQRIPMLVARGIEFTVMLTIQVEGFAPTIVSLPKEAVEQLLKPEVKEFVRAEVGKVIVTKGVSLLVSVIDAETRAPIESAVVVVAQSTVNPIVVEALARWFKHRDAHHGKLRKATDTLFYSKSDVNGHANFEGLPTSPLHIYAVMDGYEVAYKEVTPHGGKVEVTIELRRSTKGSKRKPAREV